VWCLTHHEVDGAEHEDHPEPPKDSICQIRAHEWGQVHSRLPHLELRWAGRVSSSGRVRMCEEGGGLGANW